MMNTCGGGSYWASFKLKVVALAFAWLLAVVLDTGLSTSRAAAFAVAQSQVRHAIPFWTSARMKSARPLDALLPGRPNVALARPGQASAEAPHRYPPLAPRKGASVSSASTFRRASRS